MPPVPSFESYPCVYLGETASITKAYQGVHKSWTHIVGFFKDACEDIILTNAYVAKEPTVYVRPKTMDSYEWLTGLKIPVRYGARAGLEGKIMVLFPKPEDCASGNRQVMVYSDSMMQLPVVRMVLRLVEEQVEHLKKS